MESEPSRRLLLGALPFLLAADPSFIIGLISFPLLIICSALISGSEVAYFSLSLAEIQDLKEDKRPSSKRIFALLNKPASLLATILISNNFVNISIVIVAELLLQRVLPIETCIIWAQYWDVTTTFGISPESFGTTIHFLIAIIGVTSILVLMGEIMPKIYARINTLVIAHRMSAPLTFLLKLFSPITHFMVKWTDVLEQRMARYTSVHIHSSEELNNAIELTIQDGANDFQDVDILKRIIQFGDVSTKQIMQPRMDMVAVDREISFSELLKVVRASGYSRIPVYDEDVDHIIGIIYVKDLIGHVNETEGFDWLTIVRSEVLYVPESKRISDLLKDFQVERKHIAIVVDEYGGTAGLVTLEDVMEEIIGEIKDEFDDESEVNFQQLDDRNFIFDAKTQINDVCRILEIDTHTFDEIKGDADSLAGMVLEVTGLIPKKDTVLTIAEHVFKVTKVNKRRIEEIKLTRPVTHD